MSFRTNQQFVWLSSSGPGTDDVVILKKGCNKEDCKEVEINFALMSELDAFQGVENTVGVSIWRIEKLKPVKQPSSKKGQFSEG